MVGLIIVLLILGVILGVFGFVVKGLLWLAFIGIAIVVIGAIVGFIRRGGSRA